MPKQTNSNTLSSRIIKGLKLGWETNTLPLNYLKFHTHPLVRIFRVIGGVCIVIVVSQKRALLSSIFTSLPQSISIIISLIAIIHLCYILIISFIRLRYIHYLFKNGKLEVRNSPVDRISTLALKLLMCAKYGCLGISGAGVALTIFASLDNILEAGGHNPIFIQGIADIGNNLLGIKNARTEYLHQKQILSNISTVNQRYFELQEAAKNMTDAFKDSQLFTKEELKELIEVTAKEAYANRNEGINLSNKLQESISKSEILRALEEIKKAK